MTNQSYPPKLIGKNVNRKIIDVQQPALNAGLGAQTGSMLQPLQKIINNYRGVWVSTTPYSIADEVVYGATYWKSLTFNTDSTPTTGNANWQAVGSYSGFEGAWVSTTAYVPGAEVTYSGNFWVCLIGNTNSAPTTVNINWQIAGPTNLDNIADGTTYSRVRGSELDTGTVKQLNDGTYVRTALQAALAILASADTNGNQVGPFSSSGGTDDAGWSQTAGWGGIPDLPPGVISAVAAGTVQPYVGTSSGLEYVLQSDNGGAPYWNPKYGPEMNSGTNSTATVTLSGSASVFSDIGNPVLIPNPGGAVTVLAMFTGRFEIISSTAAVELFGQFAYSTNAGGSYTSFGTGVYYAPPFVASMTDQGNATTCALLSNLTPGADLWIKFQAERAAGTSGTAICQGTLVVLVIPNSTLQQVTGGLTDLLGSTATANCTATYPTTTCAASATLDGGAMGGTPPYTYSNTRTSGTDGGSVTSGATSVNFTITTAAESAGSYTGVYKQVVTDSSMPTATLLASVTTGASGPYEAVTSGAINTTGASLLVAFTASNGTSNASATFSDSKGNTWVGGFAAGYGVKPALGGVFEMWYCINPTISTTHTVSATYGGNVVYPRINFMAFSGTGAFDGQNVNSINSASSAGPLTTGSVTTTANGDLVVSAFGWGTNTLSGEAVSVGTITDRGAYLSGNYRGLFDMYYLQPSAGAVNPSWSWTGNAGEPCGGTMAFKTSAGGATANASCTVTTTVTQAYALNASMTTTNGSCSTGSSPSSCAASGTFSVTFTGDSGATYSNSITSQTGGYSASITSGATSASGIVEGTATSGAFPPGNVNTVNLKSVVTGTHSGPVNATKSLNLTYKYTN